MLRDFLAANGPELIQRCRAKVAQRRAPRATPEELEHGIPLFLAQLTGMLPREDDGATRVQRFSAVAEAQIDDGAARHGKELLRHDFTIEQVVHDYGDLCQAIMELATEQNASITVNEFRILNSKLDNAIAGAVSEYVLQHGLVKTHEGDLATNERLAVLAHELRNLLNTTILAISAIKRGSVGFGGATAAALDRSLIAMGGLIDRTLAEVRLDDAATSLTEVIEIAPFISEVQIAAALLASSKGCDLTISAIEPGIYVEADRHILAAAVSNLLQNAFKYTRRDTQVLLTARAEAGHVFIDVADECGGISLDRSAAGSDLAITRKGVEANGGTLSAIAIPGRGCIFTIDLPQKKWDERRTA
jgi:hypothetical protein